MLVIIRLNYRNQPGFYYFGLFPIKKRFIAREIEIRTPPMMAPNFQLLSINFPSPASVSALYFFYPPAQSRRLQHRANLKLEY